MAEPFIQAVEVWTPDGERLRHHAGAYGKHAALARVSEGLSFARGEGLPGSAWADGKPVVWDGLDQRFVRRELAAAAGLEAGVAFPVLQDGRVSAVVSMLCGSREHTGGCIEVWEPNDLRELALGSGYYGQLKPFEEISRLLRFQRGRGLPGIVWERGLPHIIPDLKTAGAFIRAAAARTSGVDAGLGIPLFRDGELAHVLLLLSAHATPLARAFEIWTVQGDDTLRLSEFYYASELGLGITQGMRPALPPGEGLAMRVHASGLPFASHAPHTLSPGVAPTRASFQLALGIPVHDGAKLRAVVNLLS